jgi:mono/diheme cytochrome c family protein
MKITQLKYVFSLLLLIVLTFAAAGAYILNRGISARDEPSAAEAFIARRLRHFAIPRRARDLTNPVKAGTGVLAAATAHFADHCASCHGNDGRGATLLGRGLYPKPPDMTAAATQQLTDGELYYIIENGIRFTGMPGFGEEADNDSDAESWDLVRFVRHLPQMTDDEIAAMKQLNPKSPAELEKEERIRGFLQGDDSQPVESSHEHHH